MRYYICWKYGQNIYRLTWINESKAGIYVGVFGSEADFHTSYHADGKKHFATRRGRTKQHMSDSQFPALNDVEKFQQIVSSTMPLVERWRRPVDKFISKKKTDLIILSEDLLKNFSHLSTNVMVFNKDAEEAFLAEILTSNEHIQIITSHISNLTHYPNHKLAVIFAGQNLG